MSKRRIILFVIFITIVSLIYNLINFTKKLGVENSGLPSKMELFECTSGDFEMLVPSNWVSIDKSQIYKNEVEGVANIANPTFKTSFPRVGVFRKKLNGNDIDSIVDLGIQEASSRGIYKQITSSEYESQTMNAVMNEYLLTYDSYSPDEITRCLDLYTINNSWGYVFSFCADDNQWAIAEGTFHKMIGSISFTK